MPGPFYPPPPAFIGGRQPYAPRQMVPPSGATPDAPPRRAPISTAILALTVATWAATPQPTQARLPAPPSGAAVTTQPPPPQRAIQALVVDSWTDRAVTVLGYSAFAPLLAPDWVQAPPRIDRQLESWRAPFQMPPTAPEVVTSGPAAVSQVPYVRDRVAIDSWNVPWTDAYRQGRAQIAPILPVVSQPPVVTYSRMYTLRGTWDLPPPQPQGRVRIAPALPVVSQPPVVSYAKLYALRATWDLPPPLPQGYARVAPLIPAPAQPDWVSTRLDLESTLVAWIPPFQMPPRAPQAITSAPPGPPTISYATLQTIRGMWDVPPPTPVQYSRAATTPSAPDAPPVLTRTNLALIRSMWETVPLPPAMRPFFFEQPLPPPPYVRPGDAIARATWDIPWNPAYMQGKSVLAPLIPAPAVPDWVPVAPNIERQLIAWLPVFQWPPRAPQIITEGEEPPPPTPTPPVRIGPPNPSWQGLLASINPAFTMLAGEAQLRAGAAACYVGRFAWADGNGEVWNQRTADDDRLGFVLMQPQYPFAGYWSYGQLVVHPGYGITLLVGGDVWARFPDGAFAGDQVYADILTGNAIAGYSAAGEPTRWYVVTNCGPGELAIISTTNRIN